MTSPDDDIMDLLTAYALGALEPQEIARVSALLDERPELRAIVAELRATADRLPFALPEAAPSPDLRQRVLDRATGRAPRTRAAPVGRWLLSLGGLAAVAVIAAILGLVQVARLQSDLSATRQQLAEVQGELSRMHQDLAEAQQVIASLQGETGAAAILRTRSGATRLVAQLPPLQPGRNYQLWRIQGAGAPASVGLFSVDGTGYGALDFAPGQLPRSGETMAVTDEPDGGSLLPTTNPLIVGTSTSA